MPDPIDLRPAPMSYFRLIMRRFGEDETLRAAILEGMGLSPEEVDDPRTELSFAQQMRQFDNMNRVFGEGWVLRAPELWNPSSHRFLGAATMSAPTVGAAAEVLAKYVPVYTSQQRIKLVREPDALVLQHGAAVPVPERLQSCLAELFLLAMATTFGYPLGAAKSELRFDYMWAEPAYGPRLKEALGGDVRWRAPANAMAIPRHLLSVPSPVADPALYQSALERLEEERRYLSAPEGVRGKVERLLAHSDTGRLPSSAAALSLGMSQRTLVRRLAEAGLHYRELVDGELAARARRWLDSGVLSRAEISERLGFADATGFSRACRRWFKAEV